MVGFSFGVERERSWVVDGRNRGRKRRAILPQLEGCSLLKFGISTFKPHKIITGSTFGMIFLCGGPG